VTQRKFSSDDPKILGTNEQNLFVAKIWLTAFLHAYSNSILRNNNFIEYSRQ